MQKYNKRENKKVKKSNLTEITGNRIELKEYLGTVLECEVFVTNSLGFLGEKRLLTEVRIPKTDLYIKHLWVKEYNVPLDKVSHGYQKLKLKVVEYSDKLTGDTKYGVRYAGEKMKVKSRAKMVIPKWKKKMMEDEDE